MNWIGTVLQNMAKPLQWWVVIAPWEQGVLVRLGKNPRLLRDGIHFRIPFIDRVHRISTRLRMVSEGGTTVTTKDGKAVTIGIGVQYGINNALKMMHAVARPEMMLLIKAQALITEYAAGRRSEDLSCCAVNEEMKGRLPESEWGLCDVEISLTTIAFVPAYRLIMNEHRSLTDMDYQLDAKTAREI